MANCEIFGHLDEALRDRLLCGLGQENTQKQLLADRYLVFKATCDTAQAMELAAKNTLELAWKTPTSAALTHNMVQRRGAPTYHGKKASEKV